MSISDAIRGLRSWVEVDERRIRELERITGRQDLERWRTREPFMYRGINDRNRELVNQTLNEMDDARREELKKRKRDRENKK